MIYNVISGTGKVSLHYYKKRKVQVVQWKT